MVNFEELHKFPGSGVFSLEYSIEVDEERRGSLEKRNTETHLEHKPTGMH